MGHKGLYDDFLHLWTMQILVDPKAKEADPEKVQKMIATLIRHEPQIESFYLLACFFLSGEMKKPEQCLDISLAGLKAFPLSWRIPMTQGYISGLVLKQPVQASAFFALAASRKERSPPWVAHLAQRLANKDNVTEKDLEETMDFMEHVEGGENYRQFFKHARETWKENAEKAKEVTPDEQK